MKLNIPYNTEDFCLVRYDGSENGLEHVPVNVFQHCVFSCASSDVIS
jgi:hypothetical protein